MNLLNFLVLLLLFRAKKMPAGLVFAVYLFNYALIRTAMEFFRLDPAPIVLGLRLPVVASIVLVSAAVIIFVWRQLPQFGKK